MPNHIWIFDSKQHSQSPAAGTTSAALNPSCVQESSPLSRLHCTCDFLSFLHRSPLKCCWELFFSFHFPGESWTRPFLSVLNGTIVPEHRADSCFIEPVYNVCWMEHINRFMLAPLPPFLPTHRKRRKVKLRGEKSLLSHCGTMSAFSTGVICQPLLAL